MILFNQRNADRIRTDFRDNPETRYVAVSGYGNEERRAATGRSRCRCCGERIAKGEEALFFVWDFHGSAATPPQSAGCTARIASPRCKMTIRTGILSTCNPCDTLRDPLWDLSRLAGRWPLTGLQE